jgi:hypothetical protein
MTPALSGGTTLRAPSSTGGLLWRRTAVVSNSATAGRLDSTTTPRRRQRDRRTEGHDDGVSADVVAYRHSHLRPADWTTSPYRQRNQILPHGAYLGLGVTYLRLPAAPIADPRSLAGVNYVRAAFDILALRSSPQDSSNLPVAVVYDEPRAPRKAWSSHSGDVSEPEHSVALPLECPPAMCSACWPRDQCWRSPYQWPWTGKADSTQQRYFARNRLPLTRSTTHVGG